MASIFIASLTYTVPIERIDAVLADHLAWLKAGHDAGHFLAWGPREPRDGGLIGGGKESQLRQLRIGDEVEADQIRAALGNDIGLDE